MEALKILEEKIAALMDLINSLKAENAKLAEENAQLATKLNALESSLDTDTKRLEKFDQEKAVTKMIVNDLIKNIDSLVKHGN